MKRLLGIVRVIGLCHACLFMTSNMYGLATPDETPMSKPARQLGNLLKRILQVPGTTSAE